MAPTMNNPTLPTIDDILAATQVISAPDASTKVVRVGAHFAVKYGYHVRDIEADNMKFLADTAVPTPKVYGFIQGRPQEKSFLIMEYIEGRNLEDMLPSLTAAEKEAVSAQIAIALSSLRDLPPPDYLGSIGHRPIVDDLFDAWVHPDDPARCGPFATEAAFNEGLVVRLAERIEPSLVNLLRTVIHDTLQGHKTVFTHGDLQPKNIMVSRKHRSPDGSVGGIEITIIDWEMSGWYPDYLEFCQATVWEGRRPEWLETMQAALGVPSGEFLMMKALRGYFNF